MNEQNVQDAEDRLSKARRKTPTTQHGSPSHLVRGQDSTLAYIGESSNISSRLYNHEQTYGEDALFAYAERSDLDASHKREEIETDLIGAYYLEIEEAPLAQFGYRENVPP